MTEREIIDALTAMGCLVEACGSRVTNDPPPTDTDVDFLVLVTSGKSGVASVVNTLAGFGFKWESNEHYQEAARDNFMSWRMGRINLIVTGNRDFARRHSAATAVCRRLNLHDKADRIALFQAVLYGNGGELRVPDIDPEAPRTIEAADV